MAELPVQKAAPPLVVATKKFPSRAAYTTFFVDEFAAMGLLRGPLALSLAIKPNSPAEIRAQLSPASVPARDHPARDLALSPVHPELPRCRGTAGRARA